MSNQSADAMHSIALPALLTPGVFHVGQRPASEMAISFKPRLKLVSRTSLMTYCSALLNENPGPNTWAPGRKVVLPIRSGNRYRR